MAAAAAVFLPLEPWSHAIVSAFVSAFGQRCRIVEVSLDPGAVGEPVMRDLAASYGGFVIGEDWRWNASGQLVSPTDRWQLLLDERPTATIEDRWQRAPVPTAAEVGDKTTKIARVGAALSVGSAGIGAAVAWWMGDLDPLVAGLAYAILVLIAFVVAASVIGRSSPGHGDPYSK